MPAEVKEFVIGYIFAIIGVIVGANLLSPLVNATGLLPGEYAWAGSLITILAVLGLIMYALYAFKITG